MIRKDEEFYRKLGWALKIQRKKQKINIGSIAKMLDVSIQQINKYESGENRIPVDKLDRLCRELGLDIDWIITWVRRVQMIE